MYSLPFRIVFPPGTISGEKLDNLEQLDNKKIQGNWLHLFVPICSDDLGRQSESEREHAKPSCQADMTAS